MLRLWSCFYLLHAPGLKDLEDNDGESPASLPVRTRKEEMIRLFLEQETEGPPCLPTSQGAPPTTRFGSAYANKSLPCVSRLWSTIEDEDTASRDKFISSHRPDLNWLLGTIFEKTGSSIHSTAKKPRDGLHEILAERLHIHYARMNELNSFGSTLDSWVAQNWRVVVLGFPSFWNGLISRNMLCCSTLSWKQVGIEAWGKEHNDKASTW